MSIQKKIMLLGGLRYLKPVIDVAHNLGLYVITADYLPDNIAHKYSDEYCNVSIIDKDAVLREAQRLKIDGIMSFACDPGVLTAAYVAEQMNLPFQCSYESTKILQDKGLFRDFLIKNNFNSPTAKRYDDIREPYNDINYFHWPVIVKPVDSAGSKGCTKVDDVSQLSYAIEVAKNNSHNGSFIIEDFLTFKGFHSSADAFTIDGQLKFITYSDQLFDTNADNPYTPAMIIWPSTMEQKFQNELTTETQRLMNLLGMKTGIYNIETCVDISGRTYIMEVSPRGGGCKIAEIQQMAFGVDLITAEVKKAVGIPVVELDYHNCLGTWCEFIIHSSSSQSGRFKSFYVSQDVKLNNLKMTDLSVQQGDVVHPFTGANMALGDMFFRFDDRTTLDKYMSNTDNWMHIELE